MSHCPLSSRRRFEENEFNELGIAVVTGAASCIGDMFGLVTKLTQASAPLPDNTLQQASIQLVMVEGRHFILFVSAALVLALTPGPGILYVLGRTINGGRREGVYSSLGTLVGGSAHVIAAALGLSAVLATSATAFHVVRYAGAAYLVYLGISMIRSRNLNTTIASADGHSSRPFLQGITTEVLNPKTALFFLSFIPQFVSPARGHATLQFLTLGTISVVLNTSVDLLVVLFAGVLVQKLGNHPSFNRRQRTASGVGMIGLGVYVAAR